MNPLVRKREFKIYKVDIITLQHDGNLWFFPEKNPRQLIHVLEYHKFKKNHNKMI